MADINSGNTQQVPYDPWQEWWDTLPFYESTDPYGATHNDLKQEYLNPDWQEAWWEPGSQWETGQFTDALPEYGGSAQFLGDIWND